MSSGEYITLAFEDTELKVHAAQLAAALRRSAPPFLTDPNSEAAREHRGPRLMLKSLLKAGSDQLLKSVFPGEAPRMQKGDDAIAWFTDLVIVELIGLLSGRVWQLTVDTPDYDEETKRIAYTVQSISGAPAPADRGAQAAPGQRTEATSGA